MNRALVHASLLGSLLAPGLALASGHHGGGSGGGSRPPAPPAPSSSPTQTVVWTPAWYQDTYVHHRGQPTCVETTDVVGFRECTRYGAWSQSLRLPQVVLDVGIHVRRFPLTLLGGASAGLAARGVTGAMAPSGVATASAMRIGIGLPSHLYVAAEGELGGMTGLPAAAEMAGAAEMPGMFLAGYGVFGGGASNEHGLFALEVAAGGRNVVGSSVVEETQGLVAETRARGELWLGPWTSLGATLGTSLVERGDWMAGVYLGVHSRAFAGGR